MKNLVLILILLSFAITTVLAQAPQAITYQAVARDGSGNPLANQAIGVRITIKDGSSSGTTVYQETESAVTTNQFGLFTIQIGNGTVVSGTFTAINWGVNSKYIEVEFDPTGGTSYLDMGTTQLLSVPYALYSAQAGKSKDSLNLNGNQLTIVGGNTVFLPSGTGGGGDNWGTQTAVTNSTLQGNGTDTLPLGLAKQGATNGQVLKWNGSNWAPQADNDNQTLSISGSTLSISGGNNVTLPTNTGPQGATGATGATGAIGATGPAGAQGTTGAAGAAGTNGTNGATWYTGNTSPSGVTGVVNDLFLDTLNNDYYKKTGASTWTLIGNLTGSEGPAGATGATGATGTQGATGPAGPQGATGATGAAGPAGSQGATGATGATGVAGPAGSQGATGATGATGAAGPAGSQGATGASGATGPAGSQGTTGATGPAGPQGATGTTGSTGPQGTTGAAGTDGTNGATWYTGNAAPAGVTGVVNDLYLDTLNNEYYKKTGASTWTLIGNLTGAAGPAGPTYTAGTNIAISGGNVISTPTITLTGSGGVTVTPGTYPSFTISSTAGTTYTAGTGINISGGNVISGDLNLTGTGGTSVTGTYPNLIVNSTAPTTYTAGTGIGISGGVISNAIPEINLTGSGGTSVTGTYPNLIVSSTAPATYTAGTGINISGGNVISGDLNLTGTGGTTVTGTYPNLTVNSTAPTTYTAGTGIGISGGVISNTIAEVNLTGSGGTTVTGTYPNLTVTSTAPTTYTAGSGLTLTGTTFSNNAVTDNTTITGNGTTTTPLKVAQQGATTGQALEWNGTSWAPATVSGSGGGTLDEAYDFGGAGDGASITADAGPVYITLPNGDGTNTGGIALRSDITGGSGVAISSNNTVTSNIYSTIQATTNSTVTTTSAILGESTGAASGVTGQVDASTTGFAATLGNNLRTDGGTGVNGVGNTGTSGESNSTTGTGVYGIGNELAYTSGNVLANGTGGSFNGFDDGLFARNLDFSAGVQEAAIVTDDGSASPVVADQVSVNEWNIIGTHYKIIGGGIVSTLVTDLNNNYVTLHAPETPEAYFEDYGQGQLVNGKIHVNIDPIFAKNIAVSEKHPLRVFIQLEGDCKGVYVTNKTVNGFDVVELSGGSSNVSFQWHIVANRADAMEGGRMAHYQDIRFESAPSFVKLKQLTGSKIEPASLVKQQASK